MSICTNEPLYLSFNTVSLTQVRFSPKAFEGRGLMEEVPRGGNALRFYPAVRLRLSRMVIKTEDKVRYIFEIPTGFRAITKSFIEEDFLNLATLLLYLIAS